MAILNINYDNILETEIKYLSVEISMLNNESIIYDSGDLVRDWYNAIKYYIDNLSDDQYLSYSPNVDYFIEKTNDYNIVYLIVNDDQPKLIFDDQFNDILDLKEKILLFIYNKDINNINWEHLKEYCTNENI